MRKSEPKFPPLGSRERVELKLSYLLKIIVLGTIILSIRKFNLFLITSAVVILFFSALPALFERTFRITLPVEVDLAVTAFVFLHFVLGEVRDYYTRFLWFDLALHISSGIIIGLVGFIIIYFFLYTNRVTANPLMVAVFSVSFSLAAGALWEIFEFFMDTVFGFNMQKSGLVDTMTDLMVDFFGACIVGVSAYRYLKKEEAGILRTLINRFIQYNVWLQVKKQLRKQKKRHFKRKIPAGKEQS